MMYLHVLEQSDVFFALSTCKRDGRLPVTLSRACRLIMPSMTYLVGVMLLLLTMIEAQVQHMEYYKPDSYTTLEALEPLCKGLDRVRIGNPTNCQKFVVCCKSRAFAFVCHLAPTPGYQIYEVRNPCNAVFFGRFIPQLRDVGPEMISQTILLPRI